ncbi:MAG: ferrous iron transport protein A [Thermodesulfobacteriota bacterium]
MNTLWEAAFDMPLRVVGLGKGLEDLRDLGVGKGQVITKLREEILYPIFLLLTPRRPVLLTGGMSRKVVVAKGRKEMALTDLSPGDRARIVNFTGGKHLRDSLDLLGLAIGEKIQIKTILPVMRYICLVNDKRHLALLSGMATKVWGRPASQPESCQLPFAPLEEPFQVEKILGGRRAHANLEAMGITSRSSLRLKRIEPLPSISLGKECAIMIETAKGLRLCLDKGQAELIRVE